MSFNFKVLLLQDCKLWDAKYCTISTKGMSLIKPFSRSLSLLSTAKKLLSQNAAKKFERAHVENFFCID